MADLYRKLGHLSSVPLAPYNRWASAKVLREKWLHHIENSLYRPVFLIDEAEQMSASACTELRLLSSAELASRIRDAIAHRSARCLAAAAVCKPSAQNGR